MIMSCMIDILHIHSLRFEAFWTSSYSYLYPDDAERQHNPWYLHLGKKMSTESCETLWSPGDINSGGPGFIGGPNVVTIMGADFCVEGARINMMRM